MHDVKVGAPDGYRGFSEALKSPEMRRVVQSSTNTALMLYQAQVAKQSGSLARSARAQVALGGVNRDRWVGSLVVGEGLSYGAAHEFGTEGKDQKNAADDLEKVLKMLAAYS